MDPIHIIKDIITVVGHNILSYVMYPFAEENMPIIQNTLQE